MTNQLYYSWRTIANLTSVTAVSAGNLTEGTSPASSLTVIEQTIVPWPASLAISFQLRQHNNVIVVISIMVCKEHYVSVMVLVYFHRPVLCGHIFLIS